VKKQCFSTALRSGLFESKNNLDIFIPYNAVPELCLKAPDYRNKDIIFATQAVDIRSDNKKIVR